MAVSCGTYSGWSRHKAEGETPCEPCLTAQREYHRARRAAGLRRPEAYQRSCVCCDVTFSATHPAGRFCSQLCFLFTRNGPLSSPVSWKSDWPSSSLPADHPARWFGSTSPVTFRNCGWCESLFVIHVETHAYCTDRCKKKASACRRKATEAGTYGYWSWADFMRLAQRFDFCCAYCGTKPDRLDPDHVIPLSRGGPNVINNLLPSCLRCNGDKRDLLLNEWALDRKRRSLPPRATSWGSEDKRYWHLTYLSTAA